MVHRAVLAGALFGTRWQPLSFNFFFKYLPKRGRRRQVFANATIKFSIKLCAHPALPPFLYRFFSPSPKANLDVAIFEKVGRKAHLSRCHFCIMPFRRAEAAFSMKGDFLRLWGPNWTLNHCGRCVDGPQLLLQLWALRQGGWKRVPGTRRASFGPPLTEVVGWCGTIRRTCLPFAKSRWVG